MGGGAGTQSNFKGTSNIPANQLGQSTPHLFDPYQQNMPSEYFGNQSVSDPTNILNAYMQHMPAFLAASRSQNTYQPPVKPTVTPRTDGTIQPTAESQNILRQLLPTIKNI